MNKASKHNLKVRIENELGTPVQDQRLIFSGKQLEDGRTLADYGIKGGCILYLCTSLRGGGESILSLDPQILDPRYNFDFSNLSGDKNSYNRGGYAYQRPYGWKRVALNVKERYAGVEWLGGISGENRTRSKLGEWPVSYHGTAKEFAEKIALENYDLSKGKRFKYGRGIYSTPDPNIAELYAQEFVFKKERFKVIIQNRVNMQSTKFVAKNNYFVTETEDNIRPYGILFKKIA